METIVIKLPEKIKDSLRRRAAANGYTLSVYVRRLLYKNLGISDKAQLTQGRKPKQQ